MSDLATFLLARFAEDEAAAREASSPPWRWKDGELTADDGLGHRVDLIQGTVFVGIVGSGESDIDANDAEHIARWDPARVLAECEAKRRIVAEHRPVKGEFYSGSSTGSKAADLDNLDNGDLACATCGEFSEYGVPWPCLTLRLLALPYADHEDYRSEWRP